MRREYIYHIWPKELDFSEKLPLFTKFAADRNLQLFSKDSPLCCITFNRYEKAITDSYAEFLEAIKKNPRFESFVFENVYRTDDHKKWMKVRLEFAAASISVAIMSSDDDLSIVAHSFIRQEFGLSNPSIPAVDHQRAKHLQATVFLGRHFDGDAENASKCLREFLSLLGFRVVEGDKFRGEPIPEKVKTLVDDQAIYIGLVTGKREHNWLIAESAYALGRNKHIILIVEEGSNFHPSIHGKDYEQILIKAGLIEQSFVKLLQEFRSVGINGL
jgi:hypothetical protein